ncbi:TVP38/TMEM64 family protein [Candidatus Saccharibacteria bacterium]|nr:TVP38/TMEM64 family protein [Candidatus Saccharibacteria bacterium]NCU40346.1 TVP38/TMEM64 family protein [Candidatus Saccharibacteria bacterium]
MVVEKQQSEQLEQRISPWVIVGTILFIGVIVFAVVQYWDFLSEIAVDPSKLRDLVKDAGPWGPLILIIIQYLQLLLAPIPGTVASVLAGTMFGPWLGTLYSMIGAMLGTLTVLVLSRRLGRPFVERLVKEETLKKLDYLAHRAGVLVFFLIFLIPVLPDDIICYLAGLSKLPIKTLMVVSFVGRLPGYLVAAFVGAGLADSNYTLVIIVSSLFVLATVIGYFKRQEIEKLTRKWIYRHPKA